MSFRLLETQKENIIVWRSWVSLVRLELGIVISKVMLDGWQVDGLEEEEASLI